MKKIISLLLCLLMSAALLAACNLPATDTSDISADDDISGYNPETSSCQIDIPEFPWDVNQGTYGSFDVLVYSNEVQTTYFSEEVGYDLYSTTDEVINDAVMNRNNHITELMGVEIKAHPVADVTATLRDAIAVGLSDYDMAMPFMTGAATLAQEGKLYALNDERFEGFLNLSFPWWDKSATESLSIDGKVYFTTGDISFMQKVVSSALTFNKDMYNDLFPEEKTLYEIVEDGDWTLDKLVSMCKIATVDDGDGDWDLDDKWGMSSSYGDANGFYLAAGNSFCSKDKDDVPVFSMNTQKSVEDAIKIVEYLIQDGWCLHAQDMKAMGATDIWVSSLDLFGNGNCLFRGTAFSAIKKLRAYENGVDFGIIPLPKMDEEQEEYFTPCAAHYAYGVTIPVCAPDPEFSAYMTELMACEGKNYITDAYYEVTLKKRDAKDDESEKMLDLIFSNVVYDTGFIYRFAGVDTVYSGLVQNRSADVASQIEAIQGRVESAIDEIIEAFRD